MTGGCIDGCRPHRKGAWRVRTWRSGKLVPRRRWESDSPGRADCAASGDAEHAAVYQSGPARHAEVRVGPQDTWLYREPCVPTSTRSATGARGSVKSRTGSTEQRRAEGVTDRGRCAGWRGGAPYRGADATRRKRQVDNAGPACLSASNGTIDARKQLETRHIAKATRPLREC